MDGRRFTVKSPSELEKVKDVATSNSKKQPVTTCTDPKSTVVPSANISEERSSNLNNIQNQHSSKHNDTEYIHLLNEKNKAVSVPPCPRGYPSNYGRGRGGKSRRPYNVYNRRFRSHPDFYTSNSYGYGNTYYG